MDSIPESSLPPGVEERTFFPDSPPVRFLPDPIRYPTPVVKALESVMEDYHDAFSRVFADELSSPADYRYIRSGPESPPKTALVRVDMAALSPEFLKSADSASAEDLIPRLRRKFFEGENTPRLALTVDPFSSSGSPSAYKLDLESTLRKMRRRTDMKVAIAALTDDKYTEIAAGEYGHTEGALMEDQVRALSGFDGLLGPQDLRDLYESGAEAPLFYNRSYHAARSLKHAETFRVPDILSDRGFNVWLRSNSINIAIDAPDATTPQIADSKRYLLPGGMNLAYPITSPDDLTSSDLREWLADSHYPHDQALRLKPVAGYHGSYGHARFDPSAPSKSQKKAKKLLKSLLDAGVPMMAQPEVPALPSLIGDRGYLGIHRLYFSTVGDSVQMFSGFLNALPADSLEAKKNTIHGNPEAVYRLITR